MENKRKSEKKGGWQGMSEGNHGDLRVEDVSISNMCDGCVIMEGVILKKKGKKRKNKGKTKPTKKSYLASSNVKETVCVNCSIRLDNVPVTFPP